MLTANIGSNLAAKFGDIRQYNVSSTATTIYSGATVVLRSDGYAYPAEEDVADDNKQVVIGWALEQGTPGGTVRVRSDGSLARQFPGVTQAAIGKLALIKDDETVQTYATGSGTIVVGRIIGIKTSGLEVFVDFKDRPDRVASSLYD